MTEKKGSKARSRVAKVVPTGTAPLATAPASPHIRDLSASSCLALLRREIVGRMAFSFRDRVDITPIHYVYADGWVFARTSHGAKMTTIAHSPWVALEVDEVKDVFEWKSVVLHGTVYLAERNAGPTEARRWLTGIELLRRIVPATGTSLDPVAFRSLVFGIHVESVTGRISTLAGASRGEHIVRAPGKQPAKRPVKRMHP